jgi:hypothetical protein
MRISDKLKYPRKIIFLYYAPINYYFAWKHKKLGLITYASTLSELKGCSHNVTQNFLKWDFIIFAILYSTLLHLPPLRFHCVGGSNPGKVVTSALSVRRPNHSD